MKKTYITLGSLLPDLKQAPGAQKKTLVRRPTENAVEADLDFNNTVFPALVRTEFNVVPGENGADTLVTTCKFEDGTVSTVRNTAHDEVETETVYLDQEGRRLEGPDGAAKTLKTADRCSKERGIVYAVVKRLLGRPDRSGQVRYSKFSSQFDKFIDKAVDVNVDAAAKKLRAKARKAAKKAEKEKPAEKKEESRLYTVNDIVQLIGRALESDPSVAAKIRAIFKD